MLTVCGILMCVAGVAVLTVGAIVAGIMVTVYFS